MIMIIVSFCVCTICNRFSSKCKMYVVYFLISSRKMILFCFHFSRHADVMKKIIQTVADGGGGELGVHMYPSTFC